MNSFEWRIPIDAEKEMKAQDIKNGDTQTVRNDRGRITGGWKATGDAVVKDGIVYVPVQYFDGQDGTQFYGIETDVQVDDRT
jgi:hypothetical protein